MPLISLPRVTRAFVSALLVAGAAMGVSGCAEAGAPVQPTASATVAAPPGGVVDDAFQLGSGPVGVTIYTDASCPHCKVFDLASYEELAQRVTAGEVTLRIAPMNFVSKMHHDASDYSTRAMNLLAAIADSGQGDRVAAVYGGLLAAQPSDASKSTPDDARLLAIARDKGVNVTAEVREAVTRGVWNAWVQQVNDRALGRPIGPSGTKLESVPTVVVQNQQFEIREDGTDASRLATMIEAARAGDTPEVQP